MGFFDIFRPRWKHSDAGVRAEAVRDCGGFTADTMLRRGVRAGTVRKLMQTSAFALGALPLLALPAAEPTALWRR